MCLALLVNTSYAKTHLLATVSLRISQEESLSLPEKLDQR